MIPLLVAAAAWLPLPFTTPGVAGNTGSAHLTWTAPGDDSLIGTAAQYDLRYTANGGLTWQPYPIAPPKPPGSAETATVSGLETGFEHWFTIRTADEVPNWSAASNQVSAWPGAEVGIAYSGRGRDAGGYVFPVSIYAWPDGPAPTPKQPGELDTLWLPFFSPWTNFDPTGVDYALDMQLPDGGWVPAAAWHVRGGAAPPDSVWFLGGQEPRFPEVHGGLGFAVWPVDPLRPFRPAESQETIQRRDRARICQHFGYWMLRGVRQGCP